MKVCERCGAIVGGRDGENRCVACDGKVRASAKSNRARRKCVYCGQEFTPEYREQEYCEADCMYSDLA